MSGARQAPGHDERWGGEKSECNGFGRMKYGDMALIFTGEEFEFSLGMLVCWGRHPRSALGGLNGTDERVLRRQGNLSNVSERVSA